MNTKLINKAISEGTLKIAYFPKLVTGVEVVIYDDHRAKVIGHHCNKVVLGWDDGEIETRTYEECDQLYLVPLGFVEDKPVYVGDTLYGKWPHPEKGGYKITGKDNYGLVSNFGSIENSAIDELSWTKQVPTININGFDVPAPERELLKKGSKYYVPNLNAANANIFFWDGDICDTKFIEMGLVHLTPEAAEAHAKALLSFTKKR